MSEKEIVTLARVMFGRIKPVWKSTREPGAPDTSSQTQISAWLSRVETRTPPRHAIEQLSRVETRTATPSSRYHEDGVWRHET